MPNGWVLGVLVIVTIVQVLGEYMIIRYLDPHGPVWPPHPVKPSMSCKGDSRQLPGQGPLACTLDLPIDRNPT